MVLPGWKSAKSPSSLIGLLAVYLSNSGGGEERKIECLLVRCRMIYRISLCRLLLARAVGIRCGGDEWSSFYKPRIVYLIAESGTSNPRLTKQSSMLPV